MTHPLFRKDIFIETAFARRFQAMLRSAWSNRSWHVIVADPGAGKTMGIRDLVKTAGSRAILAVVAPKNNEEEQALGDQFFTALGLPLRGHWRTRKPKLMGHLHQYGTQCLIVDDAHDLSFQHLMLIKEVTDQGRLQYDHPLGLCLVAAARGEVIPLKETLDQPDPTWLQWRRRLDQIRTVLPRSKPHQRRGARDPGRPGNGVPGTHPAAQPTPVVWFDLHLAHTTGPRSSELWSGHDGLLDEAGDDSLGMDVPGRGTQCTGRNARASCTASRAAS